MKTVFLSVLLLSSISAKGQQLDLMSVPPDSLGDRLVVASYHMDKAAQCRNTSLWWALIGGCFTTLAMDKSHKVQDPKAAFGLGAATVAGFFSFQLSGAIHDRKAARALHLQ